VDEHVNPAETFIIDLDLDGNVLNCISLKLEEYFPQQIRLINSSAYILIQDYNFFSRNYNAVACIDSDCELAWAKIIDTRADMLLYELESNADGLVFSGEYRPSRNIDTGWPAGDKGAILGGLDAKGSLKWLRACAFYQYGMTKLAYNPKGQLQLAVDSYTNDDYVNNTWYDITADGFTTDITPEVGHPDIRTEPAPAEIIELNGVSRIPVGEQDPAAHAGDDIRVLSVDPQP
jgi:hypothetical protein